LTSSCHKKSVFSSLPIYIGYIFSFLIFISFLPCSSNPCILF
jgi:hypothetical protein